ncbi:MAG TPA: hypothetical protein VIK21_00450 [Desulfuromonadaceae bacterium]
MILGITELIAYAALMMGATLLFTRKAKDSKINSVALSPMGVTA